MGASANITAAVFAAYLKCSTKAYLTAHDEKPPDTFVADTRGLISAAYKAGVIGFTGVMPINFLRLVSDPAIDVPTLFVDCGDRILCLRPAVVGEDRSPDRAI